jgi:hypothetical protein
MPRRYITKEETGIMKGRRWVWPTCAVAAVVVLLAVLCVVAAGAVLTVRGNPALQQALLQLSWTPTPTVTDTPTVAPAAPTPTATPPPTATPTITPTPTQVTPVVLDASPTSTPSASLVPTGTDTPFPTSTSTTAPTPSPTRPATATRAATPTPADTATPAPTSTPQAEPFTKIGSRVVLSPASNGVTGSAVLFSPREITMIGFNYDGQCPIADIRLGMEGFPKPPVSVLVYLEARPYKDESLTVPIPADLPPNSANALFVYCDSRDAMMGWGPLLPPQ